MEKNLPVLYFGTPVVLVSTRNPDGTTNLAPMSSAWWLGREAVLGMAEAAWTTHNLRRDPRCALSLVPSSLVGAVDRLALTTGRPDMPEHRAAMGYQQVLDKFAHAGLTRQPSRSGGPDMVAECPIQLEARVVAALPLAGGASATAFQAHVEACHVEESLLVPGADHHVDPRRWDPLVMKFCDFFGGAQALEPSRLAAGWQMPGRVA